LAGLTHEDIDVYLASLKSSTAKILKSKVRNFFKWFYYCDKKTLPQLVSHLESNKKAIAPTKTDADVVVPEEFISNLFNCICRMAEFHTDFKNGFTLVN